jgi:hypothetical protein
LTNAARVRTLRSHHPEENGMSVAVESPVCPPCVGERLIVAGGRARCPPCGSTWAEQKWPATAREPAEPVCPQHGVACPEGPLFKPKKS